MQSSWRGAVMGGTEPVCRAHRNWEMVLAAPDFPKGCAGATWRRVVVRDDLTTEPPAHYRLVSSHDRFKMVAWSDCTPLPPATRGKVGKKRDRVLADRSFPSVRHGRH